MNLKRILSTILLCAATLLSSACVPLVIGGAAAGGAVYVDRRPPDVMGTDQRIEWNLGQEIEKRLGSGAHVNVTSFNRQVLLTGEVANAEHRAQIEELASRIAEVRGVYNETVVGMASGMDRRSRDTYLTSQVKARMVNNGKFNPLHVKVVTEQEVVYLMGLVNQTEADAATSIARTTEGIRKVVRLFEVVNIVEKK